MGLSLRYSCRLQLHRRGRTWHNSCLLTRRESKVIAEKGTRCFEQRLINWRVVQI